MNASWTMQHEEFCITYPQERHTVCQRGGLISIVRFGKVCLEGDMRYQEQNQQHSILP